MPVCPACGRAIQQSEATLKVSVGTLVLGAKSGQLYHQATLEEMILLHYGCVYKFFDPNADSVVYEAMYERVRAQVRLEEFDDIKNEAYKEASEDITKLCAECLSDRNRDPDTPPEVYECTSCGSMAIPICPDCGEIADLALSDQEVEEE